MSRRKFDAVHASYFLATKRCPECRETIFAAVGAQRVRGAIKYRWHCDLCEYKFESVESLDEDVAA